MKNQICILILLVLLGGVLSAEGSQEAPQELIFADLSWDSVMVHNRIAAFIIENGLEGNYSCDFMAGGTMPSITGLVNGNIDIDMESWHSNFREVYEKHISEGSFIDLGKNLPDAPQGWYVPRYVIEGDKDRGIAPMAPDLKTTDDLPRYWNLFKDPEDPEKGLIYLGISGWAITEDNVALFEEKNLGEYYNQSIPGSAPSVAATMDAAFKKGEGWIGYWWEPTAIMGKLDMVMIEDTRYPPADCNILVTADLPERAPDVVDFLKNYKTTVAQNNEFLAKMTELDTDAQGAAEWFLKNKEDVWTPWVDAETAERVKAALAE